MQQYNHYLETDESARWPLTDHQLTQIESADLTYPALFDEQEYFLLRAIY